MTVSQRMTEAFGGIKTPKQRQLRTALDRCRLTIEDLEPSLESPSLYPYGRKLLYLPL